MQAENTMWVDPSKTCPDCGSKGALYYEPVGNSTWNYSEGGEDVTEHLGPSKNFKCHNCSCEFILVRSFE